MFTRVRGQWELAAAILCQLMPVNRRRQLLIAASSRRVTLDYSTYPVWLWQLTTLRPNNSSRTIFSDLHLNNYCIEAPVYHVIFAYMVTIYKCRSSVMGTCRHSLNCYWFVSYAGGNLISTETPSWTEDERIGNCSVCDNGNLSLTLNPLWISREISKRERFVATIEKY